MLNNLDLSTFSRLLITLALLLQLFHLKKNTQIYSPSFFIYAVASYIMAYEYYKIDKKYTSRVNFKIFNSTVLLLIAIMTM
jgi:hypothetical protein